MQHRAGNVRYDMFKPDNGSGKHLSAQSARLLVLSCLLGYLLVARMPKCFWSIMYQRHSDLRLAYVYPCDTRIAAGDMYRRLQKVKS